MGARQEKSHTYLQFDFACPLAIFFSHFFCLAYLRRARSSLGNTRTGQASALHTPFPLPLAGETYRAVRGALTFVRSEGKGERERERREDQMSRRPRPSDLLVVLLLAHGACLWGRCLWGREGERERSLAQGPSVTNDCLRSALFVQWLA